MSLEPRHVPGEHLGSLKGCLVEGDPEQRTRERHVRRRALAISVSVQGVFVIALILVPLIGQPERIALASVMPLPPYYAQGETEHRPAAAPPRSRTPQSICRFCPGHVIPQTIVTHDPPSPGTDINENPFAGSGPAPPGEIPLLPNRHLASPRLRITHQSPLSPNRQPRDWCSQLC